MKLQSKGFLSFLLPFVLLFAVSCGSSSSSGGGGDCGDSDFGISGTWAITETTSTSSSACASEDGSTSTYTLTVVQSGTTISVTVGSDGGDLAGATFTGSICEDISDWTGSFEEDGGTTTINSTTITSASESSFSGTTTWSWEDGTDSCTGTTTITGTNTG